MKELLHNAVVLVATAALIASIAWVLVALPVGFYADGQCIAVEDRNGHLRRCAGAPRHEAIHVAPGTTFEDLLRERFRAAVARGEEIPELFPEEYDLAER